MAWEHDATIVISTRGSREQILAGKGVERWWFTFPRSVPKLTPTELDRCEALMRAWDAEQAKRAGVTNTENEAA